VWRAISAASTRSRRRCRISAQSSGERSLRPNYPSKRTGWPVASATGLCHSGHQLTRPRARPAGARFSRQRRRAMPEAGLSPSSMDNWKAGIRDRQLREPSRNGDPGVQTMRKPDECRIRAPLDLRRRNPLSLKQPSAKRTVGQRGTVSLCAAALDPQRALKEWLPS
jgi:hypothetical protein